MVVWDACAIIYFVEGVACWFDRLLPLLDQLDQAHAGHAVSTLSLLECRVKPLREENVETLALYDRFFSRRDLIEIPMTREIILEAARVRAVQGLKTPDALQAASVLSLPGDNVFLTSDRVFSRVPGLATQIIE